MKETLYFSGCWLLLNKLNNESVVTDITPSRPRQVILTPHIEVNIPPLM